MQVSVHSTDELYLIQAHIFPPVAHNVFEIFIANAHTHTHTQL